MIAMPNCKRDSQVNNYRGGPFQIELCYQGPLINYAKQIWPKLNPFCNTKMNNLLYLLVTKLKIYGFSNMSCTWFESYLTGRTQQVKIGKELSPRLDLTSGVPQGGILQKYCQNLESGTKSPKRSIDAGTSQKTC